MSPFFASSHRPLVDFSRAILQRLLLSGLILCALATMLYAAPGATTKAADQKYELRYKFAMGDTLRYRVNHTAKVKTTMEETTQTVESHSESIKAWKVTDVLPNGEIEFLHMVESIKMSNRQPKQGVSKFDSQTDAEVPAMFEQAASAVGVPLTVIRMKPNGEIVERQQKHPQPDVSEDLPITLELPSKPVAVGQKWDRIYQVPMERKNGSRVSVKTRRLCKLKSVKTGVATIEVTYQVITPIDAFVQSLMLDRMTKGIVRFDIKRGRMLSQEQKVDERVLGFVGKASSMRHQSELKEQILKPGDQVATKKRAAAKRQ